MQLGNARLCASTHKTSGAANPVLGCTGSQPTSCLTAIVAIICYAILSAVQFLSLMIVFGAYCILTYFIDIHADAAEGLMVSYLAEHNC